MVRVVVLTVIMLGCSPFHTLQYLTSGPDRVLAYSRNLFWGIGVEQDKVKAWKNFQRVYTKFKPDNALVCEYFLMQPMPKIEQARKYCTKAISSSFDLYTTLLIALIYESESPSRDYSLAYSAYRTVALYPNSPWFAIAREKSETIARHLKQSEIEILENRLNEHAKKFEVIRIHRRKSRPH